MRLIFYTYFLGKYVTGTEEIYNQEPGLTCGSRAGSFSRIVNGQNSQEQQFPWQVKLTSCECLTKACTQASPKCEDCGGSLISDKWILTAAHRGAYFNTLRLDLFKLEI